MFQRLCRFGLPPAIVLGALGVYRLLAGGAVPPVLEPGRDTPWVIAPQHNEPLVASDGELLQVLQRVTPPARPVLTNNYVHALRLWGAEATFDDPQTPSGARLRDYFLQDGTFRELAGRRVPPLWERMPDGTLRARFFDDGPQHRNTSSYHTDDLLATLGETGTPLDTPLILRDGQASVRDLLQSSLLDFHLARHEFEWSIISYARYAFPQKRWRNKYGEMIRVDDLVDELVDSPMGVGPCNGLHRLEALVVLYRADEQAHVLSRSTRRKMLQHMAATSALLADAQASEGYWTRHWPRGAAGRTDDEATVYDKLLVTGHQLEWLALAPAEVHPPRETIVRAARWTLKTILEISPDELRDHYGPFSHAARALCLWRGREPVEIWATRTTTDRPAVDSTASE